MNCPYCLKGQLSYISGYDVHPSGEHGHMEWYEGLQCSVCEANFDEADLPISPADMEDMGELS